MKALLLNGAGKNDPAAETICKIFTDELNKCNHKVVLINLYETEIAGCLGCFGCWIKTPGICVIDDAGRDVAKSVVRSDLVIMVTPVTFGGYSYELKKALDRMIPIISPFFMKINGEIHHKPRYERYPKCISVGILPEMDGEMAGTFTGLVTRNAINLHSPAYASGIALRSQSPEELREQVGKLLAEAGVKA
jgi:multimeric flavodoxin WrbA